MTFKIWSPDLFIKIFMIGNRDFIFRFITLQSIGENEYDKNGSLKDFYFFEALHDHFEAQFF